MNIRLIEPDEVVLGRELGDGASAVVYKGTWNFELVAVKKFDSSCPASLSNIFRKEIDVLSNINHENVIKMYGYCYKRHNTFIVFELMEGGSLFDYIQNIDFTWLSALNLIRDIVHGMEHLHDHDILHLDLKSPNVLLNRTKTRAKITDFGLSKIVNITSLVTQDMCVNGAKGTIRFMSPEVSRGLPGVKASDVWSFGCILIEFCTKKLPFEHLQDNLLFKMLQSQSADVPVVIPHTSPKQIKDLVLKCLIKTSNKRPTFLTIKNTLKDIDLNLKCGYVRTETVVDNSDDKELDSLNLITTLLKRIEILEKENKEAKETKALKNTPVSPPMPRVYHPSYNSYNYSPPTPQSPAPPPPIPTSINVTPSYRRTGESYVSRGSANGREIFEGPRGGRFYFTSSGGKRYV